MTKEDIKKGNPELLDKSPLKAIRAFCLDCMCGSPQEVKDCPCDGNNTTLCALYQYRLGHNPNRHGREYSEEERLAIAERLANYRKTSNQSNNSEDDFESDDENDETIPSDEADEFSID